MPITIAKTAGAGAGGDTTLTIRNFQNLIVEGDTPSESFQDIASDEDDAIIIKMSGPSAKVGFDWELTEETSSVVSGAGSPVTTAVGQKKYLFDTLMSKGVSQILDEYTLTLDYGGGITWIRTGVITKIIATMRDDQPVTFKGHVDFSIGNVF